MSSTNRGYYSIIEYCPDPSRFEAPFFARTQISKGPVRPSQDRRPAALGVQDWEFVEVQNAALEARLSRQDDEFHELKDFETFVAKRASAFRMTPPRSVKVADPAEELNGLLRRLVGSPAETRRTAEKIVSVELKNRFQAAGVDQRLQSNVSVHPPFLPKPVKVPFAFQNGKLNLIEPVQFEGISPSAVFHRASIHAVQGQFLADYIDPKLGQLGLIVVGKFAPEQEEERNSALAVFKRHNVPMHTFSSLEPLIEEIRSFAHD